MKNIVIPKNTDYELNFTLSCQQMDVSKSTVYLILASASGWDYSIRCSFKKSDGKWVGKIPKTCTLDSGNSYVIEVQYDNMRFSVVTGKYVTVSKDDFTVKVTDSPKGVAKKADAPPVKKDDTRNTKPTESVKESVTKTPNDKKTADPIKESVEKVTTDPVKESIEKKKGFSLFQTDDPWKEITDMRAKQDKVRQILGETRKG